MAKQPQPPDLSKVISGSGKIQVIVSGKIDWKCSDPRVQIVRKD